MKTSVFSVQEQKKRFSWADIIVLLAIIGLFYMVIDLGEGMTIHFSAQQKETIDLNPVNLPYYAGRSLLRMFLALGASLLFTLIYSKIAVLNRWTERIMIPVIDILQSVPVLGFLSVTVTGFMALFPNSLLGVECASIFAIFTGQVWNMTFSFYHSLRTVPKDLYEFSRMSRLNGWMRFTKLELPHAMIGLVWNGMMSFGGGWFFLAASETISVLNKNIQLPGIGSYMASAIDKGDMKAILYAILTMVVLIILVDQLFWRPIVAWSQKFRNEQTTSTNVQTSWVLTLIKRAVFVQVLSEQMLLIRKKTIFQMRKRFARNKKIGTSKKQVNFVLLRFIYIVLIISAVMCLGMYTVQGIKFMATLSIKEMMHVIWLGCLTLFRVCISTLLGALWTIPVGVAIGFHPRLSRIMQPIVQILSSFPANMAFPFLTILYVKYGVNFEVGSIPLMMLGTQWYILFNVIAGAMAIPSDLREAAKMSKLSVWKTWKVLILPGIFPYVVTGGITASGGAWNASIVAEFVSWKNHDLVATGLGSYITKATTAGNWPHIIWGIVIMAFIVVLFNRFFWRKLYTMAETKYRLD
ncbi:ABC transporter permease subunit [Bacillus cereus group sp. BfR-BA-01380]|uniref:ABC transporter permease n=1 Tax=Bacillus cereus group sp. BfR-BA-01380 TaxID=2920324 RepID=UPI001F5A78B5|nr:ABC transporter permease subunit [Bacillus cereus group sp. BfR-BA-01380]